MFDKFGYYENGGAISFGNQQRGNGEKSYFPDGREIKNGCVCTNFAPIKDREVDEEFDEEDSWKRMNKDLEKDNEEWRNRKEDKEME